ncbi:hypothetical protein Mapa_000778 [Marchantia paleacea]|nr:hypothetical protein Mapa_000778 [Marchantia paleacea]
MFQCLTPLPIPSGVFPKGLYAHASLSLQHGENSQISSTQNQSKLQGFSQCAKFASEFAFYRSRGAPRPHFGRPRGATMGISGASAVEISELADGTPTDSIPVLTLTEVANRLHDYTHPKCKPYTAMYSSVVGGITLDPAAMVVPLDDHIVHRGHGVFDTATVFNGFLYELDSHLDRLLRSAAQARIPPPFPRAVLRNVLVQTVAASGTREGTVRYWLSVGPGDFNLSPAHCNSTFYAVMIAEGRTEKGIDGGVKVITSSVPIKRPYFATMKTTNYLPNALAKMDGEDKGAFQAIWLDDEGFIAEGANMNVAFVSKGTLMVPSFDKILSGCTAKRMLVLVEQLVAKSSSNGEALRNVKVGRITVEEARKADEMMLVVSSYLILPVTEWDGHVVGNGEVGPVVKQLIALMEDDLTNGPPEVREAVPYKK